jgi:citrate lyase beta subunit
MSEAGSPGSRPEPSAPEPPGSEPAGPAPPGREPPGLPAPLRPVRPGLGPGYAAAELLRSPPRRSLGEGALGDLVARVEEVAAAHARRYPGDPGGRQPVHTVYVAADQFAAGTAAAYGAEALRLLDAHAPDGDALAAAIGLDNPPLAAALGPPSAAVDATAAPDGRALATAVRDRVAAKLATEPVEDLRIDFEDGYGTRDDAEEDRDAARVAAEVAAAAAAGTLPPFAGLRVKSFADGLHLRSIRTLDMFLTGLLERAGRLPDGLVITFPKVVAAGHVAAFAELLGRLEAALGLADGRLHFEVQVETTQSILDPDGRAGLRGIAEAAGGRLTGAHFGVYDYTAACGLAPSEQRLTHPACDFARHVMQVALAGTGVRLSDGSTAAIPAGGDTPAVHAAWRLHAAHVRHSLSHGFWQGWDLHPAQLPSRYAAVYAWHLDGFEPAAARVAAFNAGEPGPGGVLDEPATIKALVGQLRRAVHCGAVPEAEALSRTGLDRAALLGG